MNRKGRKARCARPQRKTQRVNRILGAPSRSFASFAVLFLLLSRTAVAADLAGAEALYDGGRWKEAVAELTPLADSGAAPAQFLLGAILLDGGNGVGRDRPRALALIGHAAAQGHPGAMFELYLASAGSPDGLRWAEQLASQGFRLQGHARDQAALCAEALSVEHARGLMLPRDPVLARAWAAIAVELGRGEAKPALDQLDVDLSAADLAAAKERQAKLAPR